VTLPDPAAGALGTRLRHLLDEMDAGVAEACVDVGLADYRPRFSPFIRVLVAAGPSSIRALADAIGVTHSAASQTVAQLEARGLVTLVPGADARSRIVALTERAIAMRPAIEAEWAATAAAAELLDAELPYPLHDLVRDLGRALARRGFRQRIADAAGGLEDDAVAPFRARLAGPVHQSGGNTDADESRG
jgi:DNA-binding MarR family transcriptional regulator